MADETQQNEVARYAAAVRAELFDLAMPEREALLEDLEDHLAEVLAESELPLASRLGTPEAYAAELRAAYGAGLRTPTRRFPWIHRLVGAAVAQVSGWSSVQAVREYLPELRPAWWVLRAYLVVLVLAVILRGDQDIHPIPNPFTSGGVVEIIAMAVAVVLSIRLGRWASRRKDAESWPLRAGNAVVALGGLIALGSMSTLPGWVGTPSSSGVCPTPSPRVRSATYIRIPGTASRSMAYFCMTRTAGRWWRAQTATDSSRSIQLPLTVSRSQMNIRSARRR